MSLSALNLTIFASRSRDDLTVWMLFLLKLQVSTKIMVTQLQVICIKKTYCYFVDYANKIYERISSVLITILLDFRVLVK